MCVIGHLKSNLKTTYKGITMENTPEYQEFRLNVKMKNDLISKINSYNKSLNKINSDLVDYKKTLVKACEAKGHEYGKEVLQKKWHCKRIVKRFPDVGKLLFPVKYL